MTQPRTMSIPVGIPLIGQGPTPEARKAAEVNAITTMKLWPIAAYPTAQGANGVPEFWVGETLLDRFAQKALECLKEQLGGKTKTDEELLELCKKAWKIAILMMQTRPVRTETEERK